MSWLRGLLWLGLWSGWWGTLSYGQMFKALARSWMEDIDMLLDRCLAAKLRTAALPYKFKEELPIAALFLPILEFDMSKTWPDRMEASDAALVAMATPTLGCRPSQLQRSPGCVNGDDVYTALNLEGSLVLDDAGKCAIRNRKGR